jgi:hypothetical protein
MKIEGNEALTEKGEGLLRKKARAKTVTCQEPGEAEIKSGPEQVRTTGMEETREVEAFREHLDESAVETVGTREDRRGDHRQTVRYRHPLKRWAMDNIVQGTPKEGASGRDDRCSQSAIMT